MKYELLKYKKQLRVYWDIFDENRPILKLDLKNFHGEILKRVVEEEGRGKEGGRKRKRKRKRVES